MRSLNPEPAARLCSSADKRRSQNAPRRGAEAIGCAADSVMKIIIRVTTAFLAVVSTAGFIAVLSTVGLLTVLSAAAAADLPRKEPPPPAPPVGKAPIGKYPVGKYPVGKYPQPVVTKG